MLYEVVVNDWGETTYVPTTLGNLCLVAIILLLLAAAFFFARKHSSKGPADNSVSSSAESGPALTGTKNAGPDLTAAAQHNRRLTVVQLTCCAAAIALGTILSNIKLFSFPTGGSITLISMLVICLPGYWFGLGAGIMTGIAYGVLQMLVDPYILFPAQLIVDYILAFGALGLSGLFCNKKNGLVKGYLAGILGRFVFAVISGWIFFGMYAWEGWAPLPYSLVYNGIYIFSEAAVTILLISLPPVKKAMQQVKN